MKTILSILFIFALMGCDSKMKEIPQNVLQKTYYLKDTLPDSQITILFINDEVSGSSGVNRYFAKYSLDNGKIAFSNSGSTRMMGPPELMAQEDKFLKNFNEVQKITISEDEKTITLETLNGEKLEFYQK